MSEDELEPERLCWWCKHFDFDSGSPGYSDLTPGSDFRMDCHKRVWRWELGDSEADFAKCITAARACKHYEPKPELRTW